MEQATFDTSLTRTVQPRSCDRCFLRKSKVSFGGPSLPPKSPLHRRYPLPYGLYYQALDGWLTALEVQ